MTVKEKVEESKQPSAGQAKTPTTPSAAEISISGDGENVADPELPFPVAQLEELEEMVSKPKWVVPVQPEAQLEVCLRAAIVLARKGKGYLDFSL